VEHGNHGDEKEEEEEYGEGEGGCTAEANPIFAELAVEMLVQQDV
jgi:hypothetical protein